MTLASDYDYVLPQELIAQRPLAQRSDARMLVIHRAAGKIEHSHVRDLPQFLLAGDAIVVNDTKVLPARLVGYRMTTRGRWQGLVLGIDSQGTWRLLGRTRGKISEGESVMLIDREMRDHSILTLVARLPGGQWAARPKTNLAAQELLKQIGRVPLPHYIRDGEMMDSDVHSYQTVYARRIGSVAAPTAGLHFTEELLQKMEQQGITRHQVTLHVGLGTFRPIASDVIEDHEMHEEAGEITQATADALNRVRQAGHRLLAVGTTTVRVLESAFQEGQIHAWSGQTGLFIRPPYAFRAVDAMLTNFHLPRSTLLVLVRTFGGDALVRHAYEEAIEERYRFFSYGDAMLIL
jgi:S-adenosylmethionine:tRNA ribosyltransferase-isomerase